MYTVISLSYQSMREHHTIDTIDLKAALLLN